MGLYVLDLIRAKSKCNEELMMLMMMMMIDDDDWHKGKNKTMKSFRC